MRAPLTIAVAQPSCVPYDVAANAAIHAEVVRAAGARVVVFPELSLTGYELDAPTLAASDPRLAPIIGACAETGTLALAGAPVAGQAGSSQIALLAIKGGGASIAYRKLWLGAIEARRFTPGDQPAMGIDVYVAAVLESAEDTARQDERAHRVATEHGVWVAVASFAGATGGGYDHAAGRSAIWSPSGDVVARAGPETGAIARANLE
jgi:predicted amidohydrolase